MMPMIFDDDDDTEPQYLGTLLSVVRVAIVQHFHGKQQNNTTYSTDDIQVPTLRGT